MSLSSSWQQFSATRQA